MRTPEEFESHVYRLIAEEQRRQKRLRLLAAGFVLLVFSRGLFLVSKALPILSRGRSNYRGSRSRCVYDAGRSAGWRNRILPV